MLSSQQREHGGSDRLSKLTVVTELVERTPRISLAEAQVRLAPRP